ncbi:ornithine cyclodeaminase family protein [Tropicibacter sp. R16_0]|uniref:ornithine cyclodeaminase family protein n=1 Tax=Tropicibacter sp. R16_0 TaxID=2821102 RepID=UPI001ADD4277|nr:ornithine cyclodeaminase family protein [Tropicibacter sp. R16_0]MBO9451270.1 ornithine cyclodeaminase family protein [Tropicibacter sp. R16_0]
MNILDAGATARALPFDALIEQMQTLFADGLVAPDRRHHTMPMQDEADATLLLMPAWTEQIGCVKVVTATPGNSARNLPAIAGSVLVFDRATGAHLALIDGAVATARRTAAASALGARYLAREDAKHLLIIGAGKVAAQLADAFRAGRPIETVRIWDLFPRAAEALAASLQNQGWNAEAVTDLSQAVPQADIISAATLATEPLLKGEWLQPGQHVDLIGAFTPAMREADDRALQRARLFVDTKFAAIEAGELKTPLETGVIAESDILGDLYALAQGKAMRNSPDEITLFKSVGNAVMDLAAAITATRRAEEEPRV